MSSSGEEIKDVLGHTNGKEVREIGPVDGRHDQGTTRLKRNKKEKVTKPLYGMLGLMRVIK